jgi:hypothetical protein
LPASLNCSKDCRKPIDGCWLTISVNASWINLSSFGLNLYW